MESNMEGINMSVSEKHIPRVNFDKNGIRGSGSASEDFKRQTQNKEDGD